MAQFFSYIKPEVALATCQTGFRKKLKKNEGAALKLPPGTPRTPRFLEEGGRIPGPPGKSVRGGTQPSRVRPGGETALDCCAPPLTTRYKLRIESLHV